jgi:hypothetical protein
MAKLQIRDPDPVHQILQQGCVGDSRERRRQELIALAALAQDEETQPFDPSPDDLIRQDRQR